MIDLQPCPFCGHADRLITWHDPKTILHPWYRIECDYCGCKGPGTDLGDHDKQWNRRALRKAHAMIDLDAIKQRHADAYDLDMQSGIDRGDLLAYVDVLHEALQHLSNNIDIIKHNPDKGQ